MPLSGEPDTAELASATTQRKNDSGTTEVNMATVLQGLQTTMAQLAKNSALQIEAIQNLKEDILLCSGDEDTEDNPALDDDRRDNELDIAATLDHVLDSSDINNTTSVKSPESGSQSALVESLTHAFTKSTSTSTSTFIKLIKSDKTSHQLQIKSKISKIKYIYIHIYMCIS